MNSRNTIINELNDLESKLSPALNGAVYAVPDGYFETFATSVLARIKAENSDSAEEEIGALSPLLAGLSRKMLFSVPPDYFQESSVNLMGITAEDEESLVLSFISKEMPYEVPLGYFANLPEQILEKVSEPKGKVVPMFRRKWMRMAAAAVVTGAIAVSGILYLNRDNAPAATPGDAVASEIRKATTEELDEFLKTTEVNVTTTAVADAPKKEVKSLFRDVSDKELEAFLDEIPADELSFTDDDDEVLAN